MSACRHCRAGHFPDQQFGQDVECVNGVLIDIDVLTEGRPRDTIYPLAPCHPNYETDDPLGERNDSIDRLDDWELQNSESAPTSTHYSFDELMAKLETHRRAVFGNVGDEPNVYADYDQLTEYQKDFSSIILTVRKMDAQVQRLLSMAMTSNHHKNVTERLLREERAKKPDSVVLSAVDRLDVDSSEVDSVRGDGSLRTSVDFDDLQILLKAARKAWK